MTVRFDEADLRLIAEHAYANGYQDGYDSAATSAKSRSGTPNRNLLGPSEQSS